MSVLHTVVPLELVLSGSGLTGDALAGAGPRQPGAAPGADGLPGPKAGATTMVAIGGGRFLEVEATGVGGQVARLHSPHPRDYLDPRYQPGSPWRG